MNLIPNPASVRLVAELRKLLRALQELPPNRRDNRSLALKFSTSKQTMQNRLEVLMQGGIVERGLAKVVSGHESFVYSVCAGDMAIERHLFAVRMEHARAADAQRQKTYLGRLAKKTRSADAIARAQATVALKEALRTKPAPIMRDPLVAALFGKSVPA